MDVAMLLLFALFTALVVTTTSRYNLLRPAVRMGVLRWVGPLITLVVVSTVMALSGGDGSGSGSVGSAAGGAGSALAVYSLLVCVIGASSLFRRRARSAIDPQEG
jgi:hypothetical protein